MPVEELEAVLAAEQARAHGSGPQLLLLSKERPGLDENLHRLPSTGGVGLLRSSALSSSLNERISEMHERIESNASFAMHEQIDPCLFVS